MAEYIIKINDNDETDSDGCKRVKEMHRLVRCKDCKNYPNGSGTKWTPCREIIVPPHWFCADGEMKDNG